MVEPGSVGTIICCI